MTLQKPLLVAELRCIPGWGWAGGWVVSPCWWQSSVAPAAAAAVLLPLFVVVVVVVQRLLECQRWGGGGTRHNDGALHFYSAIIETCALLPAPSSQLPAGHHPVCGAHLCLCQEPPHRLCHPRPRPHRWVFIFCCVILFLKATRRMLEAPARHDLAFTIGWWLVGLAGLDLGFMVWKQARIHALTAWLHLPAGVRAASHCRAAGSLTQTYLLPCTCRR